MIQTAYRYRLTATAVLASLLGGCGGGSDGGETTTPTTQTVNITFRALVNDAPFQCGQTYAPVGTALPGEYRVNDFRLYLHDAVLVTTRGERVPVELEQDGVWQRNDTVMLDFENGCLNGTPEMNERVRGEVPTEDYRGFCFKLGLPFDENHQDLATAPSPLNASGMLWNWRAGRKFVRIDGVGHPNGENQAFPIHLGSTQCPGESGNAPPAEACGYPNVAEICLDDFVPARHVVTIDPGKVLAASPIATNTPQTAPGCMSGNNDPECVAVMPRLGLDFTFVPNASTPPQRFPAQVQQLFGIASRGQ